MFGEQRYLKKRLKSIVCKYDGNIYRTYTLNYAEAIFSHLTSVTEAGTGSSSVPPTTFEWEIPTQFQLDCNSRSVATELLEDPENENFFSGDLDGDGISEIISMQTITTGNSPYVSFSIRKWNPSTRGYDFYDNIGTQAGIGMDGMFSVLKSCGLVIHAREEKGNSIVYPFCRIFVDSKSMIFKFPKENLSIEIPMQGHEGGKAFFPLYTFLDTDKNGIDDIVIIEKEVNNDGIYPAYLVSYNLSRMILSSTEINLNLHSKPDKILCSDFNSDGMPDLLVTTSDGYHIYWNRSGSFSYEDSYYDTQFCKCDVIEAGDFNGDGLVDLIINEENFPLWFMAQNTGTESNGYFLLHYISYLYQEQAMNRIGNEDRLYCIVRDIDGDGKSDAIVSYPDIAVSGNPNTGGGCMCILQSNGGTFSLYYRFARTNPREFPDKGHILQGNFGGHEGNEIMYWGRHFLESNVGWNQLENPTLNASSQKMISITDGLGARDSISYGLLTDEDVYSISNNHTYPLIPMAGGIPVVKKRTESIPTESRTTNYSYANGFVHLQGKGFLGFEDVKAESSTGIVTETHCVLDSTFYTFLPNTVTQKTQNGTIIAQDFNVINLQSVSSRSYTINNNTHHETRRPLDGFPEGEDCEDFEFGFPTYQFTDDYKFTTEKEIAYWDNPHDSVWIKGLPDEMEITKSGYAIDGNDVYEKITYERAPATGLVLKETRRRNGQLVSADGYSYNEYGQITRHYTVPYNSTDTLVTTFEYYPTGKLKKEYDPKGLYRLYNYRSSDGALTSIRDFDGVITHFFYDGMIRETKRQNAIETLLTTRAPSNYGGGVYSIKETKTGDTPVTTYYDAWERKIAKSAPLANNIVMFTDYHYLSNGKIGFVSFPHKSYQLATEGTTYTYDNAHRLVSTVDTNGKTSTWTYAVGQVTSCIDGVTTTTYYYNSDVVSEVDDASGWIVYDYNADKNVSYIGSADADAYYTYDTYGRLTQTTDMNGVTKQYSYDVNGYPHRTTIGGDSIVTNYDKYGILRSKTWSAPNEPSNTVSYTYDSKFRLTREAGTGYLNTFSYDTYGRMTNKYRKVTDVQTVDMSVSIQYGSDNHISSTTNSFNNASAIVTERFYYNNGYKVTNALNDSTVWCMTKQDRWGNVTETLDSLGITTYSYDDYGNMLSMNRSGNTSVSEFYTYNVQTGNMSSKNGTPLSYDSMNQLTGWGSKTFSYDSKGNITHQPYVGNFSYDGFKVDGMTADSCYVIDDSLRITFYKAIERPKSIENEHYKANFYYDGNGDRYMMKVYAKTNGHYFHSFTRYYLDANVEVTLDSLSHYFHMYYAGGDAYTAPAVMEITPYSPASIYQITRDNLGSALLYENANGNRYQYSYSPWGVRIYQVGDSIRFYQPGGSLPLLFYRTYTGHEDLWMFGLLNANARLYSLYLGRFISPDPLLNSEGGPLDFNPYIYARNNPYKYIDRNGEVGALVALGVVGLIGGGLNVWANWDDINNAGDFLLFFGVGAASGVVGAAVVAMAPAGFFAGALYGAVGGGLSNAILGGGNAAILGQDVGSAIFTSAWQGASMGFVLGGASGYISAKANGLNGWTGSEKSSNIMATRHKPIMKEPDKLAPLPSDDLPIYSQPDLSDVLEQAKSMAGRGNSTVYVGVNKDNVIQYVGRTGRNPEIRFGEHYRSGHMTSTLKFKPIITNIDHNGSRILEQQLINKYGMQKNGGQLFNKINSISPKHWEKFGIK